MNISPFQAIFPNLGLITSNDSFFSTVKTEFRAYYKSGFYQKTAKDGLYVYEISNAQRTFRGIIAAVDLKNYADGKIKIHEQTLAAKEQKHIHLLLERKAMIKPVLLTYNPVRSIDDFIESCLSDQEPLLTLDFDDSGEVHRIWELSDGDQIAALQKLFKKELPFTYIADGHHRSSTSHILSKRKKLLKQEGFELERLLCAFFPASQLEVNDYNRVIEALDEISPTHFLVRLAALFNIEPLEEAAKPTKKHELTFSIHREWYRLKWRSKILDRYKDNKVLLDASLLDELVLNDILGINDVRTDDRIMYVEGPKGLDGIKNLLLKGENRMAFCLSPVDITDLFKVSDLGGVMPPKSTWFEPRMKNGLLVQEL